MKKQNYSPNISTISKFVICLLCCLMLFSLVSRPLTVHASVAATVTIAAYGVVKIVISAKVLVGLIIGSFSGFVLSALLPEVDSWYESDPVIRNWADRYNGAIAGGEVISIPADVQQAIRDKFAVPASVALSTLYVPYDLMHLEKVSAVHVFGTDVAAQLEANNALLQENNTLLDNIKTSLSQMAQKVNDILAGQGTISTALSNIRTTIVETKNSLKSTLLNINESVGTMKNSLKTTLLSINESIGEMKNSLKTTLLNVVESLDDMRNSLKTTLLRIKEAGDGVIASINQLSTTVVGRLDTIIANFGSTTATPPPGDVPSFDGESDGQGRIPVIIGNGKDLVLRYGTAFLAVSAMLTKFLSLPVVGDLVQFGLALGLFALFVNLAGQISNADSKGAKSRKHSTSKGG